GCAVPSPGGAKRGPTSFARGPGLRARGAAECGRDRPLRRPHRLGRRIPRLRAGRSVSPAQSPAVLGGPRFFRLRPDGRFGLVARVPAAFPEDSGARRGCELLSDGMAAPDAPWFGHGGTSGRPRDAPPGGHTLIRVGRGPGLPAGLALPRRPLWHGHPPLTPNFPSLPPRPRPRFSLGGGSIPGSLGHGLRGRG